MPFGCSHYTRATAPVKAADVHRSARAIPNHYSVALNSFASADKVLNPGTGSPNVLLIRLSGTGGIGKVVFIRDGDVWMMNADRTNQTRLTNNTIDYSPNTWQP